MKSILVRVLQGNRSNYYIYNKIYIINKYTYLINLLQELTYAITKAEKSHNLPSACWKTRKASGIVLRARRANDVSPSREQKKADASAYQSCRMDLFLRCHFVSFRPSMDWVIFCLVGEGKLLYSGHQSNHPRTRSEAHPEIMLNQGISRSRQVHK